MESKNLTDENINFSYENCWKYIIRPPRDIYDLYELELDSNILDNNQKCIRNDYSIKSSRGFLMECSFYRIDPSNREPKIRPVVIYLHGNSSSRVEGKKLAKYLLNKGIDLFVFDFPGCGKSQGEFISLGYHEKNDLRIIVNFIEKLPGVGDIGIWGRSMGAATALLYNDNRIKAQCVDSPFSKFTELAIQLCKKEMNIPGFITSTGLFFIKKTVRTKNDLDIDALNPIDYVENSKTPTFFIHAMKDGLISYNDTINLYEKYGGIKYIIIVEGDHNSERQEHVIDKILNFFTQYLKNSDKNEDNKDDVDNEEDEEEEISY